MNHHDQKSIASLYVENIDNSFNNTIGNLFEKFWNTLPPDLQNPDSKESMKRGFIAGFNMGYDITSKTKI